jgi:hypothetical protein
MIFGLYPRKGTLDIGGDADLVLFDPKTKKPIYAQRIEIILRLPASGFSISVSDSEIGGGPCPWQKFAASTSTIK